MFQTQIRRLLGGWLILSLLCFQLINLVAVCSFRRNYNRRSKRMVLWFGNEIIRAYTWSGAVMINWKEMRN